MPACNENNECRLFTTLADDESHFRAQTENRRIAETATGNEAKIRAVRPANPAASQTAQTSFDAVARRIHRNNKWPRFVRLN